MAPIELSPQIGFRPAGAFVAAWDTKWAAGPNPNAGFSTPFQEAFDRADTALASAAQSAAVTKVVLLTDGESGNCFPDGDGTMTHHGRPILPPTGWKRGSLQALPCE